MLLRRVILFAFALLIGSCHLYASEGCALKALQQRILAQASQESADYVVFRGEVASLPPPRDPHAPVLTVPAVFFDYTVDEVLWGHLDGNSVHAMYVSEPPCGAPQLTLHAKIVTFCSLEKTAAYCLNPVPASDENLAKLRDAIRQANQNLQIIFVSPEEAETHLIRKVLPVFPNLGKRVHIEGDVTVRIVIDRQGRVERAQAISGHPILISSAIDAVRQYLYRPFLLEGRTVRAETTVTIGFHLRDP